VGGRCLKGGASLGLASVVAVECGAGAVGLDECFRFGIVVEWLGGCSLAMSGRNVAIRNGCRYRVMSGIDRCVSHSECLSYNAVIASYDYC
jgi:hypothetical protein